MMLRRLNLVLAISLLLYFTARLFEWNLPSYPAGAWYFNPFCWQLLFVFGAWFALGGAGEAMPLIRWRWLPALGGAYLLFALVMTMACRFPELRELLPGWLYDAFNPNDKTNLPPLSLPAFRRDRLPRRQVRAPRLARAGTAGILAVDRVR